MLQYLFNSSGRSVAVLKDGFLFDMSGQWIGWTPWNDGYVLNNSGRYLGTIFNKDRLLREIADPYRGDPKNPGYPGYPGFIVDPGNAGYFATPAGTVDIEIEQNQEGV